MNIETAEPLRDKKSLYKQRKCYKRYIIFFNDNNPS